MFRIIYLSLVGDMSIYMSIYNRNVHECFSDKNIKALITAICSKKHRRTLAKTLRKKYLSYNSAEIDLTNEEHQRNFENQLKQVMQNILDLLKDPTTRSARAAEVKLSIEQELYKSFRLAFVKPCDESLKHTS